jgi:hypothetical protein
MVEILPLSHKEKFHLELFHGCLKMMNYLSYPSHGTQHLAVNASQNDGQLLQEICRVTGRQLLQEIHRNHIGDFAGSFASI